MRWQKQEFRPQRTGVHPREETQQGYWARERCTHHTGMPLLQRRLLETHSNQSTGLSEESARNALSCYGDIPCLECLLLIRRWGKRKTPSMGSLKKILFWEKAHICKDLRSDSRSAVIPDMQASCMKLCNLEPTPAERQIKSCELECRLLSLTKSCSWSVVPFIFGLASLPFHSWSMDPELMVQVSG